MQTKTERKKSQKNEEETVMYCIGWCCIAAFAVFAALYLRRPENIKSFPPCIFQRLTGFYCPGCGGTRAIFAFARGKFLRSLMFHPFVPYSLVVGCWFMVSQTIQRLSRGRIAIGMKYRDIYLWVALGLVVMSCLVKNVLLICGIDLLK